MTIRGVELAACDEDGSFENTRNRRRARRIVAAVLGLLMLVACLPSSVAAEPATYDIPVIISLTGGGAFLGQEEQDSLKIAEKTFNREGGIHGRPIRFVFLDDGSTPQVSVQLISQAVASRPAVILGSTLVANCNAMQPFVKDGPVLYCLSAGVHPAAGSYMFASGISTFDYIAGLVRYCRLRGWTRLALITSTDATGQDADRAIDEVLRQADNADLKFVARVHFNPSDLSVAAQVQNVKQAEPQVFIAWATGSPSATIFRDVAQAGLEMPVATTAGNMTYAQMHNFAGFLPKELYLPASEWPVGDDPRGGLLPAVAAKQRELYDSFKQAGKKPDEGAILSWDPAAIVVEALRALPENAGPEQLRAYLAALHGQAGVAGVYDFVKTPQRGVSLDDVIMTQWSKSDDRWTVVSTPTGELIP
jgi:branched-chain amino acid transport system substrate-binding protein